MTAQKVKNNLLSTWIVKYNLLTLYQRLRPILADTKNKHTVIMNTQVLDNNDFFFILIPCNAKYKALANKIAKILGVEKRYTDNMNYYKFRTDHLPVDLADQLGYTPSNERIEKCYDTNVLSPEREGLYYAHRGNEKNTPLYKLEKTSSYKGNKNVTCYA